MSAKIIKVQVEDGYEALFDVLVEALNQSQLGKGKERHATDDAFTYQPICQISRRHGIGFALGQSEKKAGESHRLPGERGIKELLGSIVYTAAAIIVRRERDNANTHINVNDADTVHAPELVQTKMSLDELRAAVFDATSPLFSKEESEALNQVMHGEKRG